MHERFNSYFYELTKIVHRANSVTTFRLPCMERVESIDLEIYMGSLTRSFEGLNYIQHRAIQFECFSICHHTYIDE